MQGEEKENRVVNDAISAEVRRRRKKKRERRRRFRRIMFVVVILLIAAGAAGVFRFRVLYQKDHSFDYQMEKAEDALSARDFDTAYEAVQKAIDLDSSSAEAWILKADIFLAENDDEKAESALKKVIGLYPDNEDAYESLLGMYVKNGDTSAIGSLFASCTQKDILEKFSDYVCDEPSASPDDGEFSDYQKITLTAEEDASIYYTLDGTKPSTDSSLYTEPFLLPEGATRLRVMAVNEKGIDSDVVDYSYLVVYPTPDAPKITPASGKFKNTEEEKIEIIYPEGCTAYYAFDKKPTVESGKKYKHAVNMKDGAHTFYAIVVNSYGKISNASSETYRVNVKEEEEDKDE